MSNNANSCDSSNDSSSKHCPCDQQTANDDSVVRFYRNQSAQSTSDHTSRYHNIAPSSASSATSSAISGYTLPPHMQYFHSHHYLTDQSNFDNSFHFNTNSDLSIPEPSYSALSEKLRKSTPNEFQCSLFCGGKRCKYESGKKWRDEEKAIPGLYSHWITDDILAMSRPNTETIVKYNLIDAFKSLNIKTIINLQEPGEHAHCGNGLHASGFSYDPTAFMRENIYFYNFKWKDYTPSDVNSLLDMVKVMAFALTEGRIAVHCHAGLGRTGVLICCFLIYTYRWKAREAIIFLRSKRPYSVQMKSQIENVYAFAQFFMPLVAIFPTLSTNSSHGKQSQSRYIVTKQISFTLQSVIKRQQVLLHGYESRHLKFIPKILYFVCEKLLQLCNKHRTPSQGIKWNLVTSLSHVLDELMYSRSRESCCTSSTSSIGSSVNSVSSPLTIIINFQIDNSNEPFTRYFFSSIPSHILTDGNLINCRSDQLNGYNSQLSIKSSSNNCVEIIPATITSACSSNNSFKATEPVIREEDDEDNTFHSHFISINSFSENHVQNVSIASSSDSLNNYTGESPTESHSSIDVNYICSGDTVTSGNQQIHSNSTSSLSGDNCSQSMPPIDGELILTQQVSKILSTGLSSISTSPVNKMNNSVTNDTNSVDNDADVVIDDEEEDMLRELLEPQLFRVNDADDATKIGDKITLSTADQLDKSMRMSNSTNSNFEAKNMSDESMHELSNGDDGGHDAFLIDDENRVEKFARVRSLLENASMYVDARELESGEFIDGESPSLKSSSSSGHVTSGQEYSEILREYEKESIIGMVDNQFIIDNLLKDHTQATKDISIALNNYQKHLNESVDSWDTLSREINIDILCGLFWSWLENLKEPILNRKSLVYVVLKAERPLDGLGKLDRETRFTLEYLLRFIIRLQCDDDAKRDLLTKKLLATLTHQSIKLNQNTNSPDKQGESDTSEINIANVIPANRLWPEMRRGTNGRIDLFLKNLSSLMQC